MRYFWLVLLIILVFLAGSSGIAKIMKMPQDVDFFARYGFNSLFTIAFGFLQLIGAVLLVFKPTRFAAAVIVFTTFAFTLVLLILDQNAPFSLASIAAMVGLLAIANHARRSTV